MGIVFKRSLGSQWLGSSKVDKIAIATVVPEVLHSLRGGCQKYFKLSPFELKAGTKTGLQIRYANPVEVGADRIANCIAATKIFPNENTVIVDFGTATTFCALSKTKEYFGGLIVPGIKLMMKALGDNTAKLPKVEILKTQKLIGRSTSECIQSGLYYGNLAMIQDICQRISTEQFGGEETKIVGTGGFAKLFREENVFDEIVPDLVLRGLYYAMEMNA